MEMEQMMARLLAEIRTNQKAMQAKMDGHQAKMDISQKWLEIKINAFEKRWKLIKTR
jgi:hypothetical protein